MRRAAGAVDDFNQRSSKSLKAFGLAAAAAGAAAGAFLVSSVNAARELDKEVREVATLLGDATQEMVDGIRDDVGTLSREYGVAGTRGSGLVL